MLQAQGELLTEAVAVQMQIFLLAKGFAQLTLCNDMPGVFTQCTCGGRHETFRDISSSPGSSSEVQEQTSYVTYVTTP